ncbi:MAG: hypothetical protein U9R08_01460 [Nanoarchaeota archaeon]|nr:hypothetical protein [Nanoarchaeota archaeon]
MRWLILFIVLLLLVSVVVAKPLVTVKKDGEFVYGQIISYDEEDDYDSSKGGLLDNSEPDEEGVRYHVRLSDDDLLMGYLKFSQDTPIEVNLDRVVEVEVKEKPYMKTLMITSADFYCTDIEVRDKGIFSVLASKSYLRFFDNKVMLPDFMDKYRFHFQSNFGYNDYFDGFFVLVKGSKIVIDDEDVYVNGEKLEKIGSKSDFESYNLVMEGGCTELPISERFVVQDESVENEEIVDGDFDELGVLVVFAFFSGDDKFNGADLQEFGEEVKKAFVSGLNICADIRVITAGSCEGFKYDGEKDSDNWNIGKDCVFEENPFYRKYFNNTIFLAIGNNNVKTSYFDYGFPGVSSASIPGFIFTRYGKINAAVHELGHSFGLNEGYCYNPPGNEQCPEGKDCTSNPTDSSLDGNEPAFWGFFNWINSLVDGDYCESQTGYRLSVKGNKWDPPNGGRTYMAMEDAQGPRGWDKYDRKYLNNYFLLKCEE